jgi:membrane-bound lytic murein transglycosylase D
MLKKLIYIPFLFIFSNPIFSQENIAMDTIKPTPIKISYLDSIKSTFVYDSMTARVDSLWSKELVSQDIFDKMYSDIQNIDPDKSVDFELPTDLLKERLRLLDEKSPFNIEYNVGLENIIKSFLKNRRRSYERLMGLSQYYFPMFEEAFARHNVPLEIKYLAVVESALNSKAVSRSGATGLWQFMYQTGLQYKLDINSYVDERSDALKSSEAAAVYMENMYKIFGDWDLVLASYNSGPGNVSKAIRRSNGQKNFWNIRPKLPKETQGYVPAFIATMYIFEYYKEHGITPEKPVVNNFSTDTIFIKNKMSFKQISELLDISTSEIEFLNPSYKIKEIPSVTNKKYFLRLPKDKIATFTSNEEKMYAYADHVYNLREKPYVKPVKVIDPNQNAIVYENPNYQPEVEETETKAVTKYVSKTRFYKVKKGDNLGEIADKNNVSINDLKKWNGIRGKNVTKGSNLKIVSTEKVTIYEKRKKLKNSEPEIVAQPETQIVYEQPTTQPEVVQQNEPVAEADEYTKPKYVTKTVSKTTNYTVKKGDYLAEIAGKFKVTVSELKKWNKIRGNNIEKGDNIKIISEEKVTVLENGKKKKKKEVAPEIAVQPETQIVYEQPTTQPEVVKQNAPVVEADEYTKPKYVTKTVSKTTNYTVKKGDYLSEIAGKFKVTVSELKKWNKIRGNNIEKGDNIKIISEEKVTVLEKGKKKKKREVAPEVITQPETQIAYEPNVSSSEYIVKEGDNLFKIAKQNKVSVANLKKWNNIIDNTVSLGSVLKLNNDAYHTQQNSQAITSEGNSENRLYTVGKGENAYSVAAKFKVTPNEIKTWNNLPDNNLIEGETLNIFNSQEYVAETDVQVVKEVSSKDKLKTKLKDKQEQQLYIVRKGDSLFSISLKHKIPVADLKKLNKIKNEDLKPGMKLKLNG